jgi:hypothetical protein
MNSPANFYLEKKGKFTADLQSVTSLLKRFTWYRLFSFFLIFAPVSILGFQTWLTLIFTILFIVFFFFLVKKNIQFEKKKDKLKVLKKLVEDELLALNHQFLHFENGSEFLDTGHFFSYDLDLFGEGSLYQFVNRTSTRGGRKKLAGWFTKPEIEKKEIEKKQQAIKELAQKPEWRLQFLSSGLLFEETEEMSREIKNWAEMELELKKSSTAKWLINVIPIITFIALIPSILGFSNFFILSMVLVQWILMFSFGKQINQYFRFFGRKSELLEKYMQLLQIIEESEFQSEHLLALQKKVQQPVSASKIFYELKSQVKNLNTGETLLSVFF